MRRKDCCFSVYEIQPPADWKVKIQSWIPKRRSSVENYVPLSSLLCTDLANQQISKYIRKRNKCDTTDLLDQLADNSRRFDLNLARWDVLRRLCLTGFEGYYAHQGSFSQDIARQIAAVGVEIIAKIKRQHGSKFLEKVWQTLLTDNVDPQIAQFLKVEFETVLARYRAQTSQEIRVDQVRETLSSTVLSTHIDYQMTENGIHQAYVLPNLDMVSSRLKRLLPVEAVSTSIFSGQAEEWGYLFMMRLGLFGHPLLRCALNKPVYR